MPGGTQQGQDSCARHSPTGIYLSAANVVAGLALVVLIMIARQISAMAIREFGKINKCFTPKSWRHTVCLGLHSEVTGVGE